MAIKPYSQKMLADTEAEILLLTSANYGDTAFALDTSLTYRFNGTIWLPADGIRLFKGLNNIDCKTAGNTAITYTVPSATIFRFIPLAAHFEAVSVTGTVGVSPSVSGGTNSTAFNNIFSSSLLAALLTGQTQPTALSIANAITPLTAGQSITVRCNVAATLYTTYTGRIDIAGTYEQ
jgi:hypothetical protein